MSDKCLQCGKEFERLSQHWALSTCSEPDLTDKQKEIVKGLLMGDGTLANREETPYLQCIMTNKDYLKFLSEKFETSSEVTLSKTAKQSAEEDIDSGFNPKASEQNYKNVYRWATATRKSLKPFSKWYKTSEKLFPENLVLTPTCLRHWYVCDGGLVYKDKSAIGISVVNEKEKKRKMLRNCVLPKLGKHILDAATKNRQATLF